VSAIRGDSRRMPGVTVHLPLRDEHRIHMVEQHVADTRTVRTEATLAPPARNRTGVFRQPLQRTQGYRCEMPDRGARFNVYRTPRLWHQGQELERRRTSLADELHGVAICKTLARIEADSERKGTFGELAAAQ